LQILWTYVAIDAHKHYVVIGGLNVQMEIVLPLCRIDVGRFSEWAQKHLKLTDAVW
jgi:hypothetical protein